MTFHLSDPQWIKYGIGVGLMVLCAVGAGLVRGRLKEVHALRKTVTLHLVQALLLCALVVIGQQYARALAVDLHLPAGSERVIHIVALVLIAVVILTQIFLLIDLLERRQVHGGADRTSARMMSRMIKATIVVLLVLIFGEKLGFSVSGLLAFGGVGGIIIGMASKDVLSNLLSGVMLFYDKKFDIGDWISSPDRNIQGTVVEIGWRITKIMTFDHRPLYVPNSLFSSISVENPGRMMQRRIKTSISLRYDDADKIAGVVQDIRRMLKSHDKIDQSQTMLVNFDTFAGSSLDIMIYCFTHTKVWAEWLDAQQDVYLKIIDIVHAHGADFAFQTQTLYMADAQAPAEAVKDDAAAAAMTPSAKG